MPHAEKDVMTKPTVNGEMPQSQFINHLTSYPIVSESLESFKSTPYGQKSLEIADQGYSQFAKPILPYLATPYGYLAPYVSKADELGNKGLTRMDSTIPAVVNASENIKGAIRGCVNAPFRLAEDGKGYVLDTYSFERSAVGSDGYLARSKAAVSTGLRLTADSCLWLRGYLVPEREYSEVVKNGKPRTNGKKQEARTVTVEK